jgi:hypothetical protein
MLPYRSLKAHAAKARGWWPEQIGIVCVSAKEASR